MSGWHHQLDGHEFEQAPGVRVGQGGLACCDSWGRRVGHNCVIFHFHFGSPVVKTLPSNLGSTSLILSQRAKIPHASRPKKQA